MHDLVKKFVSGRRIFFVWSYRFTRLFSAWKMDLSVDIYILFGKWFYLSLVPVVTKYKAKYVRLDLQNYPYSPPVFLGSMLPKFWCHFCYVFSRGLYLINEAPHGVFDYVITWPFFNDYLIIKPNISWLFDYLGLYFWLNDYQV